MRVQLCGCGVQAVEFTSACQGSEHGAAARAGDGEHGDEDQCLSMRHSRTLPPLAIGACRMRKCYDVNTGVGRGTMHGVPGGECVRSAARAPVSRVLARFSPMMGSKMRSRGCERWWSR